MCCYLLVLYFFILSISGVIVVSINYRLGKHGVSIELRLIDVKIESKASISYLVFHFEGAFGFFANEEV